MEICSTKHFEQNSYMLEPIRNDHYIHILIWCQKPFLYPTRKCAHRYGRHYHPSLRRFGVKSRSCGSDPKMHPHARTTLPSSGYDFEAQIEFVKLNLNFAEINLIKTIVAAEIIIATLPGRNLRNTNKSMHR